MKICCVKTDSIEQSIVAKTGAFKIAFDDVFKDAEICWIERSCAETDTKYKQLIPYILVQNAEGKFACYPRHGTESRLHGLYSCGIGGHIDFPDAGDEILQTIHNGMFRELSEEFNHFQKDKITLQYLGIINETESKVGLVHLGLVFFAKCVEGYIPEPADELSGLQWKTREEIHAVKKEFWSDIAFTLLDKATVR